MVDKDFTSLEDMSYEQALAELEEIVQELESGDQDLQVTLKLFERGQNLANYCLSLLDDAELKVEEMMEDDEDDVA